MKKIKQISSGINNQDNFKVILAGIALKLQKAGQTFSSYNTCPSLPSFVTDDRKQFQRLNIVLNDKLGP